MADVTVNSKAYNVEGKYRMWFGDVSGDNGYTIPKAIHGMNNVVSVSVTANTAVAIGAAISGSTVTLAAGGAFSNAKVVIVGQ